MCDFVIYYSFFLSLILFLIFNYSKILYIIYVLIYLLKRLCKLVQYLLLKNNADKKWIYFIYNFDDHLTININSNYLANTLA